MNTQDEANKLVEEYGAGRFPVPVIEIAKKLGINVLSDPNYPNDRNGHISLNENDLPTIVVNGNQVPERKRFTIAHEIAHFVFDKDYLKEHRIIDRDGDSRDATYRSRERRANEFAANLLMPEKQFIDQWIALNDLSKVSDYFAVSKDSARFRAINIGLIAA